MEQARFWEGGRGNQGFGEHFLKKQRKSRAPERRVKEIRQCRDHFVTVPWISRTPLTIHTAASSLHFYHYKMFKIKIISNQEGRPHFPCGKPGQRNVVSKDKLFVNLFQDLRWEVCNPTTPENWPEHRFDWAKFLRTGAHPSWHILSMSKHTPSEIHKFPVLFLWILSWENEIKLDQKEFLSSKVKCLPSMDV